MSTINRRSFLSSLAGLLGAAIGLRASKPAEFVSYVPKPRPDVVVNYAKSDLGYRITKRLNEKMVIEIEYVAQAIGQLPPLMQIPPGFRLAESSHDLPLYAENIYTTRAKYEEVYGQ